MVCVKDQHWTRLAASRAAPSSNESRESPCHERVAHGGVQQHARSHGHLHVYRWVSTLLYERMHEARFAVGTGIFSNLGSNALIPSRESKSP